MSLVGLVNNLAERLLNQSSTPGQEIQTTPKAAGAGGTQSPPAGPGDQFTPSSQSGQAQNAAHDAGLFTVAQPSFFTAAADSLLGRVGGKQPAVAIAAPAGADGNVPTPPPAARATDQTAASAATAPTLSNLAEPLTFRGRTPSGADGNPANVPNGSAPAVGNQAAAGAVSNGAAGATTANLLQAQQQLQSLNNSLVALGLTPQQVQQLDQIASIINDFNPTFFTALAYQLQELAQAQPLAQSAAQPPSVNTQAATVNSSGTNTSATSANAATAFQLQDVVIKFAGVQAQAGTAKTASTGAAARTTATNGGGNIQGRTTSALQIEEVNLTLVNGNGQTAQIQAPAAPANTPSAPKTPVAAV